MFSWQAHVACQLFDNFCGMQWNAGNNVREGGDFTLYSVDGGIVVFEKIKRKKCVRTCLCRVTDAQPRTHAAGTGAL